MGCDIHAYIEHKETDSDHWWAFGGRTNPGRNYLMFNIMAGVRGSDHQLFEPRGIPDNTGFEVRRDHSLLVVEDEKEAGNEGCTSRERAEAWVKGGSSEWIGDDKKRVTHPDWHTHSWLTVPELERVFEHYLELCKQESWGDRVPTKYLAVLAAMKTFAEAGEQVRLVFWFDN